MTQEQAFPRIRHRGEACSVLDCELRSERREFCTPHYRRWRKYGDPTAGKVLKQSYKMGQSCAVQECVTPARHRGWCGKHYDRWAAHGDPEWARHPHPVGSVRVKTGGYVEVLFGGKTHLEHRLAWEATYGPLLPGQNIHHRNGDRADNRLANLEVWDTSQPAGQRPEDKVAYALMILDRYPGLAR